MAWTLKQLAEHVNGQVIGDDSRTVESVATLKSAKQGQLSFLTNPQYRSQLASTQATAVIVDKKITDKYQTNLIVVENPHAAYARIAQLLYPENKLALGIHPTAVIEADCQIGDGVTIGANCVIASGVRIDDEVTIGANCYIGEGSVIGKQSIIRANVSIQHGVVIGKRCLFHSGSVIGADGFGQAYDNGEWIKVPQVGGVVIGDDVEVGASTTIDRGAIEDTVIGDGVKLDNQIQIAHNVRIGAHTVIAAGTGIAGSARIGKNCMIAGMVGIAGHLEIVDNTVITAMSMVTRSINEAGSYSSGIPSEATRTWRRYVARFKRLDGLEKRIVDCERQLKEKG